MPIIRDRGTTPAACTMCAKPALAMLHRAAPGGKGWSQAKVRIVGLHKLVISQDLVALVVAAVEQRVRLVGTVHFNKFDVDESLWGWGRGGLDRRR